VDFTIHSKGEVLGKEETCDKRRRRNDDVDKHL
jgi:hypothetical protein